MRRFFFSFIFFLSLQLLAQEKKTESYLDLNYFKGNIALHNNKILGLITGQPEGFILSWNKKTFGEEAWEQRYNYPDYGASFIYQNLKNESLGNNFGIYGHYNFYFLNRNLMLRVGQGLAHTSNPYDRLNNPKNIAFGSRLLSSTYLMLNYKKERVFDRFGLQTGLTFVHYSNANVKAPNTSINTIALNVGVTYNVDEIDTEYVKKEKEDAFTQPIKYNFAFRTGINQSDIVGSAQYPFYIVSAYADKRVTHKSALQFGVDMFFSNFLKELIQYESTALLNNGVTGDEDYKRAGVFVGHELFINRYSVESQLGYYFYYPFDFETRVYFRAGLKRYFGDKWFAALTLKSHGARAEAVELGLGIRL
ncbi:lipid A 3-O-deacylase PagL [Winogradskyella wandonensis]|uniref:Lipid A 3-O-deacylase PagL n=1 Tax=Winogradskyella wandonensis TaxID=1442586 RepID=A0A4R1KQY3_9FLAO|nr:acyloxyacyl hydrolase [Winogradskyella wandonensis]TCK67466.1 lipid A 3-O-deacylase PagL [Winogradskyella wandonensis]